jgi:hypothetical protein
MKERRPALWLGRRSYNPDISPARPTPSTFEAQMLSKTAWAAVQAPFNGISNVPHVLRRDAAYAASLGNSGLQAWEAIDALEEIIDFYGRDRGSDFSRYAYAVLDGAYRHGARRVVRAIARAACSTHGDDPARAIYETTMVTARFADDVDIVAAVGAALSTAESQVSLSPVWFATTLRDARLAQAPEIA